MVKTETVNKLLIAALVILGVYTFVLKMKYDTVMTVENAVSVVSCSETVAKAKDAVNETKESALELAEEAEEKSKKLHEFFLEKMEEGVKQ